MLYAFVNVGNTAARSERFTFLAWGVSAALKCKSASSRLREHNLKLITVISSYPLSGPAFQVHVLEFAKSDTPLPDKR